MAAVITLNAPTTNFVPLHVNEDGTFFSLFPTFSSANAWVELLNKTTEDSHYVAMTEWGWAVEAYDEGGSSLGYV